MDHMEMISHGGWTGAETPLLRRSNQLPRIIP